MKKCTISLKRNLCKVVWSEFLWLNQNLQFSRVQDPCIIDFLVSYHDERIHVCAWTLNPATLAALCFVSPVLGIIYLCKVWHFQLDYIQHYNILFNSLTLDKFRTTFAKFQIERTIIIFQQLFRIKTMKMKMKKSFQFYFRIIKVFHLSFISWYKFSFIYSKTKYKMSFSLMTSFSFTTFAWLNFFSDWNQSTKRF